VAEVSTFRGPRHVHVYREGKPIVKWDLDNDKAMKGVEYNKDPGHLRDTLLYNLTVEAQRRVKARALSRRELIRRLGTSADQFYRLLDQTNYRKSVDQLLSLLQILDCDVRLIVRPKTA